MDVTLKGLCNTARGRSRGSRPPRAQKPKKLRVEGLRVSTVSCLKIMTYEQSEYQEKASIVLSLPLYCFLQLTALQRLWHSETLPPLASFPQSWNPLQPPPNTPRITIRTIHGRLRITWRLRHAFIVAAPTASTSAPHAFY
jgi:hypothetical protein